MRKPEVIVPTQFFIAICQCQNVFIAVLYRQKVFSGISERHQNLGKHAYVETNSYNSLISGLKLKIGTTKGTSE